MIDVIASWTLLVTFLIKTVIQLDIIMSIAAMRLGATGLMWRCDNCNELIISPVHSLLVWRIATHRCEDNLT